MAGITGFSAITGAHFPGTTNVTPTNAPAAQAAAPTAPVPQQNADNTTNAIYSAVTSANASTIRGSTVDITT